MSACAHLLILRLQETHHAVFDLLNTVNSRFSHVSKAVSAHSLLVMNDDIYEEQTVHIILQQSSPFTPKAVGGQGLFSSASPFRSRIPATGSRPGMLSCSLPQSKTTQFQMSPFRSAANKILS